MNAKVAGNVLNLQKNVTIRPIHGLKSDIYNYLSFSTLPLGVILYANGRFSLIAIIHISDQCFTTIETISQ